MQPNPTLPATPRRRSAGPVPLTLALTLMLPGLIPAGSADAAQLGLVVGIDDYRHGSLNPRPGELSDLQGAVNDARSLAEALREAGVDLPAERVLLNEQATRAGLLAAWGAMRRAARPGDTLVLAYSGHGGQETEQPGLGTKDEADDKDETLMLHDFDPKNPLLGRLSDDEMTGLFADAAQYRILFIGDTCHAAGLYRGVRRSGHSRFGGGWPVSSGARRPPETIAAVADSTSLPHVTFLLANDKEAFEIDEVEIDGQWRGALSWSLGRALGGAAEQTRDGQLTRGELGDYLYHTVRSATEHQQTPRVLPAPDAVPVLAIAKQTPATAPADAGPIRARAEGLEPPSGLIGVEWVEQGGELAFAAGLEEAVTVRNRVGDDLTRTLPADDAAAWQRVIDAARLMRAIDAVNQTQAPVAVSLDQGDQAHPLGRVLAFRIGEGGTGTRALTLFNLSGNGELQYVYPLPQYQDPPRVELPFELPPSEVTGPIGGETLVAVLCEQPPEALQGLLERAARESSIPTPAAFLGAIADQECQIARYPWFSTDP